MAVLNLGVKNTLYYRVGFLQISPIDIIDTRVEGLLDIIGSI